MRSTDTCELTCSSSHSGGSRATLGRCGPRTGDGAAPAPSGPAPVVWTGRRAGLRLAPPLRASLLDRRAGPGAVADLLRLITAARRGRSLREPLHLAELARAGLVRFANARVWVREWVPPLSDAHLRRLPPALRGEHRLEYWQPPDRLG